MEQGDRSQIDESVLLRYFSGELGEDEAMRIKRWIETSEENRTLAKEIHYIHFASMTLRNLRKPVPADALRDVKKRIGKRSGRSFLIGFQRIAAILVLPLFLLSAYFVAREFREIPVEFQEVHMSPGMIGSVVLPDGSKVWLNSDSRLRYPDHFTKDIREVELNGEAYFSVMKDPGKSFIVHASKDRLKVEVLGTEFNMDAYSSNNLITTTLVSGSVQLFYEGVDHGEHSLLMKPDDKVEYNKENGGINKRRSDVDRDISWREGTIILKNTPLKEVLWTLSKRFNVEFEVRSKKVESSSFTGIFKHQQLERILEHFKIASGINYSVRQEIGDNDEIKRKRVIIY